MEQDKILFEREELKKHDLVFFDRRYKVPTNSGLNKSLKVCLNELGIGSQDMTATAGRHTYGSYLLANGIDIWIVEGCLVIRIYSRLSGLMVCASRSY